MLAGVRMEKRIVAIDVARGVAILLVVYGHAIEIMCNKRPDGFFSLYEFDQWRFLYSFHMPLFFMISGMASIAIAKKTPQEQLSRFLFLVLLAVLMHLAGAAIVVALSVVHGTFGWTSAAKTVFMPLVQGMDYSTVIGWFLVSLAAVSALYYACVRFHRPAYVVVGLILALSFGSDLYDQYHFDFVAKHNIWQLNTWWVGFLFFTLGAHFHRLVRTPKSLAALAACALALMAATAVASAHNHGCTFSYAAVCRDMYGTQYFSIKMNRGYFGFLPVFFFAAACGSVGMYYFSAALARAKAGRWLAWLGRHTLEMLLINGFVLRFLNQNVNAIPYPGVPRATVAVAAIVIVQIVLLVAARPWLRAAVAFVRRLADGAAHAFPALPWRPANSG
jgi:fucose 4-O-acetylase-like acetyltransferase